MPAGTSEGEILVHESRIQVPYSWSAGETLTRFLKALRDESRFLATRCPGCRKVFVPPRKSCGTCFQDCGEWLEVGPRGRLLAFTQALYGSPAHPRPKPLFGLILLEGADTALLHLLGEASLDELSAGMSLEPVFAGKRSGSILDILHFRPSRIPLAPALDAQGPAGRFGDTNDGVPGPDDSC